MRDIVIFTRQDVKCWYEISYDDKEKAIILRIHKDFIKAHRRFPVEAPILKLFERDYNVKAEDFSDDFRNHIGYEETIKYSRENGEFVEFKCALPVMKKLTDTTCPECDGTGKMDEIVAGMKCSDCYGTGKKFEYFSRNSRLIITSLSMIFRLLEYYDQETNCNINQLLKVGMGVRKGLEGGASIYGAFGVSMINWLKSIENGYLEYIQNITEDVYKYIDGYTTRSYYDHDFRAEVRDGEMYIHCPGDRTLIHPYGSPGSVDYGEGYDFVCHNVDYDQQQLTLLVGLAVLHDRARKEIQQ